MTAILLRTFIGRYPLPYSNQPIAAVFDAALCKSPLLDVASPARDSWPVYVVEGLFVREGMGVRDSVRFTVA